MAASLEDQTNQARIREFYEQRAHSYGQTDPEGAKRYEAAIGLASFADKNNILDVGCKSAQLDFLLHEHSIPCRYFGIDITSRAFGDATRRNSMLVCADVSTGVPFQNSIFTHVFCLEMLEHVTSPMSVLAEIRRVLIDGGQLVLSVPNPYYWAEVYGNLKSLPDTEGHISSFTWQNVHRLLDFTRFRIRARRGTYLRIPFFEHVKPNILIGAKPWLFARSVVYVATKG